jgi:hypothetical protein
VVVGSDGKGEAVEQDVVFDHEKLDAYRVARELVGLTSGFLKRNISRDLRDQLDRSSTSILFNIAEGAGKTARADKQRFYEIARGSARVSGIRCTARAAVDAAASGIGTLADG